MCINKSDNDIYNYFKYTNFINKQHRIIKKFNSKFKAKQEVNRSIEFNFRLSTLMDYVDLYNYLSTIDPNKFFINETCGIHIHCDLSKLEANHNVNLICGRLSTFQETCSNVSLFAKFSNKDIRIYRNHATVEYRFLKPTIQYKELIRYILDVQCIHQIALHETGLYPLNQNKLKLLTGQNNISECKAYLNKYI
jgi:uncharacterized protein (DUF342 family)